MQQSLPWSKHIASRIFDVLALAMIAFTLWKLFGAPRNLNPRNAQPAPHAIYAKLGGGTFRVVDARGRLLFLDFYASWCEPCRIELPLVERWAEHHRDALVVPVDVGESRRVAFDFAREYDLADVALDPHAGARALFAVDGLPTVVVIDPGGRIRAKWEGLNPAIGLAMSHAEKTLLR